MGNIDLREGATDDDAESMRPTSVHFGGVVCNAWSRQSATRERFVHQSEEAHNAWIGRRRALARMQLEDIVFVECVVGYDVEETFVKP